MLKPLTKAIIDHAATMRRRKSRRLMPQEEQAFDIVDEVRQSDLRRRSRDPDGPDEQTHPTLLLGEDMLDARTDFRFGVVGVSAAFTSGRNASNSTAASNASSWSPRSLNRFNRSSTSKNPACLRIESSPIHPSQWNQKGSELARFLEASSFVSSRMVNSGRVRTVR
jgi:hypothetical protein